MEMVPVQSSNVAAIGYDETVRLLRIEFKDGSVYDAYAIDPQMHDALMATSSKGGFISRFLQTQLRRRPAIEGQPPAPIKCDPNAPSILHTHDPDDCCAIGKALADGKVRGNSWICPECGMEWRPVMIDEGTVCHWEPHPCILVWRR